MLYFAEKLLRDGDYILPDIDDDFAKRFDMALAEVQEIRKQFEHDKLFIWEDTPTEIEDEYGSMKSEMTYDALAVNKKEVEKLIKYLKERYDLRQKPFTSREAVVSIVKQIENTFKKGELMRIIEALPSKNIAWQIRSGKYSLTDLLFRHAYAESGEEKVIKVKPLSFVLAEFLNPIYFNIHNKKNVYQLFKYIDGVLNASSSKEDYQAWLREVKKYLSLENQDRTSYFDYKEQLSKSISIKVATQHRLFRDKWLSTKRVLDVIFKHISQLEQGRILLSIPIAEFANNHISDDNLLLSVFKFLMRQRAIEPVENEKGVIESYRYQLIKSNRVMFFINTSTFEEHHSKVTKLYNFIEQDGKTRFPEAYGVTPKRSKNEISLKSADIKFDDTRAIINVGDIEIQLPPYKHEYYFCQVMFERQVKEPISWDIIFDKMTGEQVSDGEKREPLRKDWQKVNDTMKRLNNRIKSALKSSDKLFSWSERTIIRNY